MDRARAARLGDYIRGVRRGLGVSAHQLADAAGVDRSQITRIEQGAVTTPRAVVLGRIAKRLDVPVADLLTMADYPLAYDLPGLRSYMRVKYAELSDDAVDEIEAFIEELTLSQTTNGPALGGDEH